MSAPLDLAVTAKLVDGRKENTGRHLDAAVGSHFHGLIRVAKKVLPCRDLAGQIGDASPEERVKMDVPTQRAQQLLTPAGSLQRVREDDVARVSVKNRLKVCETNFRQFSHLTLDPPKLRG